MMLRGDQAGIHFHTSPLDGVVVKALSERRAPQLPYFQSASFDPVLALHTLQHDHAMSDALQLQIVAFGGPIIQQEHGAIAARKVSLQAENLSAIAQGIAGK